MANRLTPDQITQILQLYSTLGTYAAVAKQMGISAATVSRYVKQAQTVVTLPNITYTAPEPQSLDSISLESIKTFSELTSEEQQSFERWYGEFGR